MISKLDLAIAKILDIICIALVGGLFLLVTLVVGMRLSGLGSPAWSDEIVELMLAWLIFLGAAGLWRRGEHFRVDLLDQLASRPTTKRLLAIIVEVLCICFLGILTYFGMWFAWFATDTSPTFALARVFWFAAMPVSSALMLGYSLARLLQISVKPAN